MILRVMGGMYFRMGTYMRETLKGERWKEGESWLVAEGMFMKEILEMDSDTAKGRCYTVQTKVLMKESGYTIR